MVGRLDRPARPCLEVLEARCLFDTGLGKGLLVTFQDGSVARVPQAPGESLASAMAREQARPEVRRVEPDTMVHASLLPNDPRYPEQYSLSNSGQNQGLGGADVRAPYAWDLTTGSTRTVVAIIDSGIDTAHADLYLNLWLNPGEVPTNLGLVDTDADGFITFRDLNTPSNLDKVYDQNGNGYIDGQDVLRDPRWANRLDDDHDGKVDDLIGWDFLGNDNDPFDDFGHGTHVAGILGAVGDNGEGIAGVNWAIQMAPLKFLDGYGDGSVGDAIEALDYALSKGIRLSNNSWGGTDFSQTLQDAISRARLAGHLFVAAAGNAGVDNDFLPEYPASFPGDNILSVAATNARDRLAYFSNRGKNSVDVAAPGEMILSTLPGGYGFLSGTSMATPQVAGVAALIWSQDPGLGYAEVARRILDTSERLSSLTGKLTSGGRLDAYRAVQVGMPDQRGPWIESVRVEGLTFVDQVRITFSEPIDPATFTLQAIQAFTGPRGRVQGNRIQPVAGSNSMQFDVFFPLQTRVGEYRLWIGPKVRDDAGNPLDQDRDGKLTDADAYLVKFKVIATTRVQVRNKVPARIQDFRTATSRIVIGVNRQVADVNVRLGVAHSYVADLTISLVGPDGTRVDLMTQQGGSGRNLDGTTFDDQARTYIGDGLSPFRGSFQGEMPLSAFVGRLARGTWTLLVQDGSQQDTGKLLWWSLDLRLTCANGSVPVPKPTSARTVVAVSSVLPGSVSHGLPPQSMAAPALLLLGRVPGVFQDGTTSKSPRRPGVGGRGI